MKPDAGILYVVATPLGNRADLSPRAVRVLKEVTLIAAEDTRTARRLLAEAHIAAVPAAGAAPDVSGGAAAPRIISCFDANEADRAGEIASALAAGHNVALISEAGTPLVSDPGFRIVAAAIAAGARVVPVPGPSAVLSALVGAGLPTDRFLFLGFPPRKSGARRHLFETLRLLPYTLVFYESPLRAGATLQDLEAVLGADRKACLARELTKEYEEFVRGTLAELAARYRDDRPLGEVTLVVAGAAIGEGQENDDDRLEARADTLLSSGLSPRDVVAALTTESGRPRRDLYRLVLARTGARDDDSDGGDGGDDDSP